jgi:Divergent CRAL/TRIO domain
MRRKSVITLAFQRPAVLTTKVGPGSYFHLLCIKDRRGSSRCRAANVPYIQREFSLYYVLPVAYGSIGQTLSSPTYEGRNFEVIVDCTAFTSLSEVPVQWLKYCIELIPYDIRKRFTATYILNPNGLTHRYLCRIYNVSAGEAFHRCPISHLILHA